MAKTTPNSGRAGTRGAKSPAKRGFYIVILIVAVLGIGGLSYMATSPRAGANQWDSTLPKLTAMGHVEGSDSARLEVLEFADFECPVCGQFATLTEPDIRTHLIDSGVIRMRFMDFPLNIHRNTWNAHRAAWCAGDQGRFWQLHDVLFNQQDKWNGEATGNPDGVIADYAKALGLNMDQFNKCVSDRKYQAQLQANEQEAERRGINQTPTFVFGTKVVPGYLTYDQFKAEVEQALARQAGSGKQ
ncbi:MAG TPA: thioredoxin domain-containing protein [Gemmatimonadaceae bacterium]|jgi:protein-disulfide isomerase|nr:thioredoxin domain-containing protein [Gemmatimonadaceae bacterium]